MSTPADDAALLALLDHLVASGTDQGAWSGWQWHRVGGGGNNLLYRATGTQRDLAVKFTIRDGRDRAGREHAALAALVQRGLPLGPRPLLLERERYPQPVVVAEWLGDEVADAPPADDAEWAAFLAHYAALHDGCPDAAGVILPEAVLTMGSAEDGQRRLTEQLARFPEAAWPVELRELCQMADAIAWPAWAPPARALCRCDPNPSNFLRRPSGWRSVDWENAGWGDPAFELADLRTHPAHAAVPAERWQWVERRYADQHGDPALLERARVYTVLMLAWWAARFARARYELPRGLDPRLTEAAWRSLDQVQASYARYLEQARAALTSAGC